MADSIQGRLRRGHELCSAMVCDRIEAADRIDELEQNPQPLSGREREALAELSAMDDAELKDLRRFHVELDTVCPGCPTFRELRLLVTIARLEAHERDLLAECADADALHRLHGCRGLVSTDIIRAIIQPANSEETQ